MREKAVRRKTRPAALFLIQNNCQKEGTVMTNDFENDSNGRDSEHDPDKDNSIEDFIEMLE